MGTGEAGTPMKAAKSSIAQDQQPPPQQQPQQANPAVYPEWAAAFQAYYNSGGQPPPGYFPPPVVSGPQPHPYMWGGQPLMPPYGTPPPYGAMYPHGGMYAHPSMPPGTHPYSQFGMPSPGGAGEPTPVRPQTTPAGAEAEGNRSADVVKDRSPLKTSKGSSGSLGMLAIKGGGSGKGKSGSANGVFSQSSAESASDGSSEGSEENSRNMHSKRAYGLMGLDSNGVAGGTDASSYNAQTGGNFVSPSSGVAAGQSVSGPQSTSAVKASGGAVPTTNLGIGIQDYWSASNPGAVAGGKGGQRGALASTSNGLDEREIKRQRRKQSNRESARRSRLRKQADCEELGTRVDTLTVENMALRTELNRLQEECKKLTSDRTSLLEQLRLYQAQDTSITPEQRGDYKQETLAVQPDGNGKLEDKINVGSPAKHVGRREVESCEKLPTAMDAGVRPETIGEG